MERWSRSAHPLRSSDGRAAKPARASLRSRCWPRAGISALDCQSVEDAQAQGAADQFVDASECVARSRYGAAGVAGGCLSERPTHQQAAKITSAPSHTWGRTASSNNIHPKSAAQGSAVNSSTPSAWASALA